MACGHLAGVVQREDVGVREDGGDLDLAQEAVASDRRGEVGPQHLHGNTAAVPQVLGKIDGRHPAASDLFHDPIPRSQGVPRLLELIPALVHAMRLRTCA